MSTPSRIAAKAYRVGDMIQVLHDVWRPEVGLDDRILEMGCNCGINLYYMDQVGYTRLMGLEINPNAIKKMDAQLSSKE